MGWTSEQAMREDLEYIAAAYEGRIEMLGAIFGKSEDASPAPPAPPDLPPLTPDAFDCITSHRGWLGV